MSASRSQNPPSNPTAAAYALGFEFVASIVGMLLIGYFIDWWRGSSPLWTLVFVALGFAVGMYMLFRGAKRLNRAMERQRRERMRVREDSDLEGKDGPDAKDLGAGLRSRRGIDSWFESKQIEEDADDGDFKDPPGFDGI